MTETLTHGQAAAAWWAVHARDNTHEHDFQPWPGTEGSL